MDYVKVTALESAGIRQYVHKFDQGMQEFYYYEKYGEAIGKCNDPVWKQENPEEAYKLEREFTEGYHIMRKENLKKQFRYLLRVTLQTT